MLNIFTLIHRIILQALYGGAYACWHVANDGTSKVFWSNTLEDAMEWVTEMERKYRLMSPSVGYSVEAIEKF